MRNRAWLLSSRSHFSTISRAEALRVLKLEDNPRILTKEEAVAAFRRVAKTAHPDVGGSTVAFQRAQDALSLLSQELPSEDELIRARAADVDLREEQRFAQRRGMGSLLAAPRGIFQKLRLNAKQSVEDRIARSKDYLYDKLKSNERPVETTGRDLMTSDELAMEKEMEELKMEELRTKGVGRMVDKLISEAVRDG